MRELERVTGRRAGGSTGTNLWGAFQLIAEMLAAGRRGSVVTLLCDGGERYSDTYYSDEWVTAQGLDLVPPTRTLRAFAATGEWPTAG
jgi:cysteine synthase A